MLIDDYMGVTNRVARSVSRRYPNIQKDEIRNELVATVMEEWEYFEKQDPDSAKIWKSLYKRARRTAGSIRRGHLAVHAQYDYLPDDIREILSTVFRVEDHADTYVPRDARAVDPAEPREQVAVEIAADVAMAIEYLDAAERTLLERRYVKDESLEPTDRKRLQRTIDKLTKILNTYKFQRK